MNCPYHPNSAQHPLIYKRSLLIWSSKGLLASLCALLSCSVAAMWVGGCAPDQQNQSSLARPTVVLRVVHDPEIRALLSNAKEQFYAQHGKLSDGTPVALELVSELNVPASRRLAQGDLKAEAWITPLHSLAELTNRNVQSLGASQIECRPLFRSPLLIAAPAGLVPQLQVTEGHVSWRWLMTQLEASGAAMGTSPIAYSHGFPEYSGSGVAAISLLVQLAKGIRPVSAMGEGTATASRAVESVDKSGDSLSDNALTQVAVWQRLASHYSMSENYLMERVARSSSRRVYLSLATEQQMLQFQKSQREDAPKVVGLFPEEGTIWSTYQLCTSGAPWVTTAHRAVIRALGDFFIEPAGAALAATSGFRSLAGNAAQASTKDDATLPASMRVVPAALPELSGAELSGVLQAWPTSLEKPGALMVVLDSSGSMEGESLRAAKEGIRNLIPRLSSRDRVGFISFGSEIKDTLPVGTSVEQLMSTLDGATALGGSAAYDGLRAGIEGLVTTELNGFRKTLLMITDGEGQNSELSAQALQDYLGNRLSRHDINVLVVALRREGASFNDFDALVRGVNGFFRMATPAELGSVIQDAMRNI